MPPIDHQERLILSMDKNKDSKQKCKDQTKKYGHAEIPIFFTLQFHSKGCKVKLEE
jgi:hypothetical protein